MTRPGLAPRDVTLLELLDRALDKGVILRGDVTVSVADVDLIYIGLKLLLSSVETAERMRMLQAGAPPPPADRIERESVVGGT